MPAQVPPRTYKDTPQHTPSVDVEYRTGLTVEQFARSIGVSRWTVCRMIRDNEIRSFKIGTRRVIPACEVDDYIARRLAEQA